MRTKGYLHAGEQWRTHLVPRCSVIPSEPWCLPAMAPTEEVGANGVSAEDQASTEVDSAGEYPTIRSKKSHHAIRVRLLHVWTVPACMCR